MALLHTVVRLLDLGMPRPDGTIRYVIVPARISIIDSVTDLVTANKNPLHLPPDHGGIGFIPGQQVLAGVAGDKVYELEDILDGIDDDMVAHRSTRVVEYDLEDMTCLRIGPSMSGS